MNKREIELLCQYFLNEESRLQAEFDEQKNRIRFRRITLEDNIEMILIQQRLSDFQEFSRNVMNLLSFRPLSNL